MRIAIISTSFPESSDGSEAAGGFVRDFAQELATQDAVWVVAPGACESESVEGGLHIVRFRAPRLPLSLLSPVNPGHWPAIVITLWNGWAAARTLSRAIEIDHVLAFWALPSGFWARATGTNFSVWCLGSDIWVLSKVPVVKSYLRHVLRQSQLLFADGIALANDATRISSRECRFLPSSRRLPVKLPARPLAISEKYVVGFLGRWHPNKGIDLLMEALQSLSDSQWRCISRVEIAGGGPLESTVMAATRALQDAGRPIIVKGFLDSAAAATFLDTIDILVIPSRIESIPVIFSDAMQAGRPVISTPVGDLPALVKRYNVGRLAENATAAALAKALGKNELDAAIHCAVNCAQAALDFDVVTAVRDFKSSISATA
ncbi:MAG: glycosyltransferase [Betaproteobacteria bacterium]